jgi:hypothetical protein
LITSWLTINIATFPPRSNEHHYRGGIPVNIIIATDGYVTLGVGYHSCIVATEEEDILLQGDGPDDGFLFLMQSYRS